MENWKFLLILILFLTQCKSTKTIQKEENQAAVLTNLAIEKLGTKYSIKENEEGSHVIVFKTHKRLQDLMGTVSFFIYEKSSQSSIFEDKLNAGSVNWVSDSEIIAVSRNLKEERDKGKTPTKVYYYNVNDKKKRIAK